MTELELGVVVFARRTPVEDFKCIDADTWSDTDDSSVPNAAVVKLHVPVPVEKSVGGQLTLVAVKLEVPAAQGAKTRALPGPAVRRLSS